MATVKKLIGRLPVYKGDWVAGTYSMLNQVSYLGSTFQSKIDNNTSQPATLVNNVLQVNSNWSVVSNGTAAYVANDRLTACETASTYAQAGVDTLRSDVQGVNFPNAINDGSKVPLLRIADDNKPFTVVIHLKDLSDSGASLVREHENGIGGFCIRSYNGKISVGIFNEWIISNASYSKDNSLIAVSYDGTTSKCWINGVLYSKVIPYTSGCMISAYKNALIYRIEKFNTELIQQQIDMLYNQGRCDEVVFGDEWRGVIDNPDLSTAGNYILVSAVKTGDKSVVLNYSGNATSSHIVIKTKRKGLYRVRCKAISSIDSNLIYIAGFTPAVDVKYISINNSTNTDADVIIDNSSSVEGYIIISRHSSIATPDNITLSEIEVESINILNEYLPNFLTKTKWIDSGSLKQDILLTSPKFTYVKPYKDFEFAEGAPTTSPVASGCMRIDRTNKRAYLSILK